MKKYIKNLNTFILIMMGLAGLNACNLGNNTNKLSSSSTKSLINNLINSNDDPNLIERVDFSTLNFDFRKGHESMVFLKSMCTNDGNACVKYISDVGSSYTLGQGVDVFVLKDYPNIALNLILKNGVKYGKDFKLSDIYTEFGSKPSIGKILQVDTQSCESMSESSTSCVINYTYTGLKGLRDVTNFSHFVFTYKSVESFDVTIANHNDYTTNENIPVMNTYDQSDIMFIPSLPVENNMHTGLGYGGTFGIDLKNYGDGAIVVGNPRIKVSLDIDHRETVTNLFYKNPLSHTSCGNTSSVEPGVNCLFDAYASNKHEDDPNYFMYGRFLFSYYPDDEEANNIRYNKGFILGKGELSITNDIEVVSQDVDTFEVMKLNTSSPLLGYSTSLSNVKFRVVHLPQVFLGATVDQDNGRINYDFGDYNGVSAQEVLDSLKFDFDPKCFDSYNIDKEDNDIDSTSCKIQVRLDPRFIDKTKLKDLAGILVAEYDSPIEERHVVQALGNFNMRYKKNYISFTPKVLGKEGKDQIKYSTFKASFESGYAPVNLKINESTAINDFYDSGVLKFMYTATWDGESTQNINLVFDLFRDSCKSTQFYKGREIVTCIYSNGEKSYTVGIFEKAIYEVTSSFHNDKVGESDSFGDYKISNAKLFGIKTGDHPLSLDKAVFVDNQGDDIVGFRYQYDITRADGKETATPIFDLELKNGFCRTYATGLTSNAQYETCVRRDPSQANSYKIVTMLKDVGDFKLYTINIPAFDLDGIKFKDMEFNSITGTHYLSIGDNRIANRQYEIVNFLYKYTVCSLKDPEHCTTVQQTLKLADGYAGEWAVFDEYNIRNKISKKSGSNVFEISFEASTSSKTFHD